MATCDHCGRDLKGLEYTCRRCNNVFCTKCRLPESHDCVVLKIEKAERRLKREEGEVRPWFKDDFRLSNVGSSDSIDREEKHVIDEFSEPTAECGTCGTALHDHEIVACPYCEDPYCGEHIGAHRSKCFDPPSAGTSTNPTDYKSEAKGGGAVSGISNDGSKKTRHNKSEGEKRITHSAKRSTDEDSKSQDRTLDKVHEDKKKGERLREAAKRAEEKRYPDLESSPDVAPDGSLIYPDSETDSDNQDIDSQYENTSSLSTLTKLVIVLLVVGAFVYLLIM